MLERRPRLEGKVAIVTGAGSRGPGIGNGKATAILFAREGAKVLLVDRVPERAYETLESVATDFNLLKAIRNHNPKWKFDV